MAHDHPSTIIVRTCEDRRFPSGPGLLSWRPTTQLEWGVEIRHAFRDTARVLKDSAYTTASRGGFRALGALLDRPDEILATYPSGLSRILPQVNDIKECTSLSSLGMVKRPGRPLFDLRLRGPKEIFRWINEPYDWFLQM